MHLPVHGVRDQVIEAASAKTATEIHAAIAAVYHEITPMQLPECISEPRCKPIRSSQSSSQAAIFLMNESRFARNTNLVCGLFNA
eukprot:scaffold241956_cov29-Tisochrysis_lutea.AAC.10